MLLNIFLTFSRIGAFTLGGGYAMVSLIEKEVVDRHAWLSREQYLDILAVSQAMPGIFAMNMASHIGYKLRGLRGGLAGAAGVALPSVAAILLIAVFFHAFGDNPVVERIFRGVRPAIVALIAAPCFSMAKSAGLNRHNIWIPVLACLLIAAFGLSPVLIIIAASVGGAVYGRFRHKADATGSHGHAPNHRPQP